MNVIEIKNVTKEFKVYSDRAVTLKESVLHTKRHLFTKHRVLEDINIEIEKGETVGLIGENGCGKSTLLKLMTRILYPDKGTITVNGRVSSLLELGAGFHPDLSGRDNIYINSAIFGLSKKETSERFQNIVDFSELHAYIDNPVRTYSSGMYMRLAFSVAINVSADILLIDEILAVGDSNFQAKCFKKLRRLKSEGVTIVLVSHDASTVESFCNRAIWLNDGQVMIDSTSHKTLNEYRKYMNEKQVMNFNNGKNFDLQDVTDVYMYFLGREPENKKTILYYFNNFRKLQDLVNYITDTQEYMIRLVAEGKEKPGREELYEAYIEHRRYKRNIIDPVQTSGDRQEEQPQNKRYGNKNVEILEACLLDKDGNRVDTLRTRDSYDLRMLLRVNKPGEGYVFGMEIYTSDDVLYYANNTKQEGKRIPHIPESGCVICKIKNLPLLQGEYKMNVAVEDENGIVMDTVPGPIVFNVVSDDRSIGILSIEHEWAFME